jgi:hypothetical protein
MKYIKKFETLNNFIGGVIDHMRIQGVPVENGQGGFSQRPKHVIMEDEEEYDEEYDDEEDEVLSYDEYHDNERDNKRDNKRDNEVKTKTSSNNIRKIDKRV